MLSWACLYSRIFDAVRPVFVPHFRRDYWPVVIGFENPAAISKAFSQMPIRDSTSLTHGLTFRRSWSDPASGGETIRRHKTLIKSDTTTVLLTFPLRRIRQ